MTDTVLEGPIKSAFPVVYGTAFFFTLTRSFIEFCASGLPQHLIDAFPNAGDQRAAWTSLVLLAFAISLYVFMLYMRLEFFESKPDLPKIAVMPPWWRRSEFFLRLIIIAFITLMLTRWSGLSSLLVFHMILTFLFCVWILLLQLADNGQFPNRALWYFGLPGVTLMALLFEQGQLPLATLQLIVLPLIATIAVSLHESRHLFQKAKIEANSFRNTFFPPQ